MNDDEREYVDEMVRAAVSGLAKRHQHEDSVQEGWALVLEEAMLAGEEVPSKASIRSGLSKLRDRMIYYRPAQEWSFDFHREDIEDCEAILYPYATTTDQRVTLARTILNDDELTKTQHRICEIYYFGTGDIPSDRRVGKTLLTSHTTVARNRAQIALKYGGDLV